jgi:hypothetical protein
MLGFGGVTLTETRVGGGTCTVKFAESLTPLSEAVTLVDPAAVAVANPALVIDAIDPVPTVQVAVELTLAVVPSLYVAVAVNCSVAPTLIVAVDGVTLIETTVAAFTVRSAAPLIPLSEAVTLVDPAAVAVAKPTLLTEAIDPVATPHVALEVMLAVEPSL